MSASFRKFRRCRNPGTAVAVVLFCMLPLSVHAAISVTDLRCEYLPEALGVDTVKPRFSWKIVDNAGTRGQKQTSYRILVASGVANIHAGTGDLWDATVTSEQSVNIEYGGSALSSGMDCYWKVQVKDKNGVASAWSDSARFSIGLLSASDWKGSWIGMASAAGTDCPWFRKTFALTSIPGHALAYIGSVGFHELYVNGQKVGDAVLCPSVCDMAKRVLYKVYDIAPFLKVGNNTIGVWSAPGWSRYNFTSWDGFGLTKYPIFIGQVELKASDGTVTRITTDNTWKCHLSSTVNIGNWETSDFGGEKVDARNDIPGWSTPDLNETGWSNATAYSLTRTLSSDLVPPNRKCAIIQAASVTSTGGGYLIKMNEIYSGWVEINLKGAQGTTATINVNNDGSTGVTMGAQNMYIFGASGQGVFCNRFSYHEVLYIFVSGVGAQPALTDIKGYRISNDQKRTGTFDCSNATIKKEYDITMNTCGNLTTGGIMCDCPHRERLGYGGDGQCDMEATLNNYEAAALYMKWARDWMDTQLATGELPNTAPVGGGGGGPVWGSFAILMPWQVYQTCGDKRILEKQYSTMKQWLAWLDTKDDANSIIQNYRPDNIWYFLGDHASPSGNGGANGILVFNACNYLYETRIMSQIAQVLGNTADSATYATKANAIKAGINAVFYNTSTRNYVDTRQVDFALPLLSGAVPTADIAAVTTNLQNAINNAPNSGHIDAGMLGTYYLVKYLTEAGRSDLVYTMATQTTAPGWANLIQRGFTTWPGETWTSPATESPIHATWTGIGGWFQEGIAGIRFDPANGGFKQFIIKPAVVGNITTASAQVVSMYGTIVSNWSLSAGKLTHTIEIPVNSTATYYFPDTNVANIKEGAVAASSASGVQYLRKEGGYSVFQVQSGKYAFTNGTPVSVIRNGEDVGNLRFIVRNNTRGGDWLVFNPFRTPARVTVVDMAGHIVASAGSVKGRQWVTMNAGGNRTATGLYLILAEAQGKTLSRKIMVVR